MLNGTCACLCKQHVDQDLEHSLPQLFLSWLSLVSVPFLLQPPGPALLLCFLSVWEGLPVLELHVNAVRQRALERA